MTRFDMFLRDGGQCAHCGIDTDKLQRALLRMDAAYDFKPSEDQLRRMGKFVAALQRLGWVVSLVWRPTGVWFLRWPAHLWEGHHARARVEGGDDSASNLVTLCLPCHRRETVRLGERREALESGNLLETLRRQEAAG